MNNAKLEWIKFGVYGFLLSIIGASTCGCAERLEVLIARDAFNMLTLILLVVGVVVLIVGIAGAVLAKDTE